jgi:hypothetical protein
MEERGRIIFTRVGQQRNDRFHAADLWFRELEQIANVAPSTVNRADTCGESNLLALPRSVFVDIHDVVWAVNAVEIDNLCHS